MSRLVKASRSVYVDVDASRNALNPSIAAGASLLSIGWIELNAHGVSQVFLVGWNAAGWVRYGGPQNQDSGHRALDLTVSSDGRSPYLAWIELNSKNIPQLYVKYREGDGWISDGRSLNMDPTQPALNPSLSAEGSPPCLAWSEYDANRTYQLYVKYLSQGNWKRMGEESLNISSSRDAIRPAVVSDGTTAYVAWSEPSERNMHQIYIKRWNGKSWDQMGGSLNMDTGHHALSPSLVLIDHTPYVAWIEFDSNGVSQLHVKHWENNAWHADGNSLNQDPNHHALSPSISRAGSTAYVAWTEYDGRGMPQVRLKYRNGPDWITDNPRTELSAVSSDPILSGTESSVSIAWKEVDSNGLAHIVVKQARVR